MPRCTPGYLPTIVDASWRPGAGRVPTLADVALYGQMIMLRVDPTLPPGLGPELTEWVRRVEKVARR